MFWISLYFFINIISLFINRNSFILIWVFLTLIAGLRYNVGTDYITYDAIFSDVLDVNVTDTYLWIEPGYLALINFVDIINGTNQLVLFIIASLSMYYYYNAFKYFNNSKLYLILSLLFFIAILYFPIINISRQMLAVSIFFFAIKYIIQKQFIKYLLFILLAAMFHKTAIILIPMYWLLNIKYSKFGLIIFFIISILILILNPIQLLINIIISNELPYYNYFEYKTIVNNELLLNFLTMLKLSIFIPLLSLIDRNQPKYNLIFNGILFFIILKMLILNIEILNRLLFYFKPILIVFIIVSILNLSKKVNSLKHILIFSLLIASLIYFTNDAYSRSTISGAFNQYSINLGLFNKEILIIDIYDKHDNLYKKDINNDN